MPAPYWVVSSWTPAVKHLPIGVTSEGHYRMGPLCNRTLFRGFARWSYTQPGDGPAELPLCRDCSAIVRTWVGQL